MTSKMNNAHDTPILSATEQKPTPMPEDTERQRADVGDSTVLLELFSRIEREDAMKVQAEAKHLPVVHDSVTDKNCDVMDSADSEASREDLLRQIQLLKAQMKEQQDQHNAQLDKETESFFETLAAHEEQIQARDDTISCLKKEVAANNSKHMENAREEVKEEMEACDFQNALLRGKFEAEKAKVERLESQLKSAQSEKRGTENLIDERDWLQQEADNLRSIIVEQPWGYKARGYRANLEAQIIINTLKDEVKELKWEVKNLQSALLEEMRSRVPQRTDRAQSKDASFHRVEHLEKEAQNMKTEIQQLKSDLRKKTIMENGEMDKRNQLQQEVDHLRSTLHEERVNRNTQIEITRRMRDERAWLEAEMDQLRSQVSRQNSLLHETSTASEGLRKVKILEERMAKLQAERDSLCLQVGTREAALVEKDTALKKAQNRIKSLEDEKHGLQSSMKELKTALSKYQKDTEDASSKVKQQEQEIIKQKATAQALEENLKSARDMFKTMVESRNAKFSAAMAGKKSAEEKRVVLQRKIQELSDALKASQQNNSALQTHNQELQETIRTKEETENRRKQKKKWFGRIFGR